MRVYLSPHHDDVCFSIGVLASRMGGTLVNAFTVSRYIVAHIDLPTDPDARIEAVTELRRQEDLRFTDAASLSQHDLGLFDAPLRGFKPFDLAHLEQEVILLSARLLPCLLNLFPSGGDPHLHALYCPMGIGGHRNHLSLLLAVHRAFETLEQRCDIFLYEDLHYASEAGARQQGLIHATRLFAGLELSPIVTALDRSTAKRKLGWVRLYASQHARPPVLMDYSPASGLSPGPHEIVWRVSHR